ncbi:HpcH/HpaI aldolase family protein [Rhodococcus koreensis]
MATGAELKQRMHAGQPVHAVTLNFNSVGLAEYLFGLGFDCVVLDGEHNALDDTTVENVARAADAAGGNLIVRLPLDPPAIERYLALGATGVHIPNIASASEAQAAVHAAKFAPVGRRGLGNFRALRFDVSDWPTTMSTANENTIVLTAIETPEAAAQIDAILAVDGIDVILLGELDLSSALGLAGQPAHPEVRAVSQPVVDATLTAGRLFGGAAGSAAQATAIQDRGATFVLTSCARLLRAGSNSYFAEGTPS